MQNCKKERFSDLKLMEKHGELNRLLPRDKDNKIVKYTPNELKVIYAFIMDINKKDTYDTIKCLQIKKLGFLDEHTENYTYIKQLCFSLQGKPFQLPGGDGWIYNWFTKVRYKNGAIEYQFHPDIKDYIYKIRENVSTFYYNIDFIYALKGKYSIRLYEILKQYHSADWCKFTIENIRELLGVGSNMRTADFSKMLDKTLKEIEAKADLDVSFDYTRKGRKNTHINFYIDYNIKTKKLIEKNKNTAKRDNQVDAAMKSG